MGLSSQAALLNMHAALAGGERPLEDYTFAGSGQSAEASLADQAAQSAAASTFEVSIAPPDHVVCC